MLVFLTCFKLALLINQHLKHSVVGRLFQLIKEDVLVLHQ